jgi:hypothetical protein
MQFLSVLFTVALGASAVLASPTIVHDRDVARTCVDGHTTGDWWVDPMGGSEKGCLYTVCNKKGKFEYYDCKAKSCDTTTLNACSE